MNQHDVQFGLWSTGLIAAGLSIVFIVALERSRTNVFMALGTLSAALAILTLSPFVNQVNSADPALLARFQGSFEAGSLALYSLFILALLDSATVTRDRLARLACWAALGLAGWHATASFVWPAQRLNDYELSLGEPGFASNPGFWLFAGFWLVAAIPYTIAYIILTRGTLDPAEARRAVTALIAAPMAIAMTAIPPPWASIPAALWLSLAAYGAIQYTSARAERGVFLSQFLSPRVTELVDRRGLAETMKPHDAEITVVSADLRGFTSYSEGVPSQSVVDLLADYYDAVGEAAGRHGATITNYAGDGVLILVGAPIEHPAHASTGIQLARELIDAVEPVIQRWQTRLHSLGLGVGVASGSVTVGAISAETRMEYTAIGMPVNLAARLCSVAASGEVLIDAEAVRLSGVDAAGKGTMEIKGFSDPQEVYALRGLAPSGPVSTLNG